VASKNQNEVTLFMLLQQEEVT